MGIHITITKNHQIPNEFDEKHLFYFEDDEPGYYEFMFPVIKDISNKTGIFIDLYGDATFPTESLIHLRNLVKKVNIMIMDQPESWPVFIGEVYYHKKGISKKEYANVKKMRFQQMLQKLSILIKEAEHKQEAVVFLGD